MLTDARVGLSDTSNYPVINFTLNAEGSKKFADYTGAMLESVWLSCLIIKYILLHRLMNA